MGVMRGAKVMARARVRVEAEASSHMVQPLPVMPRKYIFNKRDDDNDIHARGALLLHYHLSIPHCSS